MHWHELLSEVGLAKPLPGEENPQISGVTIDSREVEKGSLFVAIRGQRADGHQFISQAIARGAAAVIASRSISPMPVPFRLVTNGRELLPQLARAIYRFAGETDALKLIGITGTNGKTTTAFYCQQMAKRLGLTSDILGTIVNTVGGRDVAAKLTTPEVHDIYRYLSQMQAAGSELAVMEVSSHALALGRLAGLRFHLAAFTNFSEDHLDFHGDLDTYFSSKKILFSEHLRRNGIALINCDDDYGMRLKKHLSQCEVHCLGQHDNADYRYEINEVLPGSHKVSLRHDDKKIDFSIPVIGSHNVANAIMAIAILHLISKMDVTDICHSAAGIATVPGRLELIGNNVFVDYAHTPDGLQQALSALRFPGYQLCLVFGAGGDRDPHKRPKMGRIAERHADRIIITTDNPRSEDAESIASDILSGMENPARAKLIPDRAAAIREAVGNKAEDEIVLIAGKGHEKEQIVGQQRIAFNDADMVRRVLQVQA